MYNSAGMQLPTGEVDTYNIIYQSYHITIAPNRLKKKKNYFKMGTVVKRMRINI